METRRLLAACLFAGPRRRKLNVLFLLHGGWMCLNTPVTLWQMAMRSSEWRPSLQTQVLCVAIMTSFRFFPLGDATVQGLAAIRYQITDIAFPLML